jgi:antitoxin component of RelBE/YafQ-DinJ toxin-antitoxin module
MNWTNLIPAMLQREADQDEELHSLKAPLRLPKRLLSNAKFMAKALGLEIDDVVMLIVESIVKQQFDTAIDNTYELLGQQAEKATGTLDSFLPRNSDPRVQEAALPLQEMKQKLEELTKGLSDMDNVIKSVSQITEEANDKLGDKD